jgi:hypothetical protein
VQPIFKEGNSPPSTRQQPPCHIGGPGANRQLVLAVGNHHYRGCVANDDDLAEEIRRKIQAGFPNGLRVPLGVSEDEAVRAVHDQFREAGLDCSDEAAREIVWQALGK